MEENNKSRGARYGEGAFCIIYLLFVWGIAIYLSEKYGIAQNQGFEFCTKAFQYGFGFMMAVLLGVGDTFHLVPRIIVCFRGSMWKQELQFLYLQ